MIERGVFMGSWHDGVFGLIFPLRFLILVVWIYGVVSSMSMMGMPLRKGYRPVRSCAREGEQ